MSRKIEFFYDYASPYSYLANSQLSNLVARTNAEIVYKPSLLGAIVMDSGNQPPPSVPSKRAYMAKDMQRWVKRLGVPFEPNPYFPMNSVKMMRAALVLLNSDDFLTYHKAMFDAVWTTCADLSDPEVIHKVIVRAGLDADAVMERIEYEPIKAQLKANNMEALERGAFGLPTFFIDDEMFFGNDRINFVEEALQA